VIAKENRRREGEKQEESDNTVVSLMPTMPTCSERPRLSSWRNKHRTLWNKTKFGKHADPTMQFVLFVKMLINQKCFALLCFVFGSTMVQQCSVNKKVFAFVLLGKCLLGSTKFSQQKVFALFS